MGVGVERVVGTRFGLPRKWQGQRMRREEGGPASLETSITPDYRGKRDCNNPWGALGLNLGLEPAQAAPGT